MQRKPGFPVANCSIKMPDSVFHESIPHDEDGDQQQRRLQLINFGHTQWGFNNWSWAVTKQELDFVDFSNGKYSVGVVAFVSITVKSFDIHRENIGYASSIAPMKGSAIFQARKSAVTNALRETLLSFGGSVAAELMDMLEMHRSDVTSTAPAPASVPAPETATENKPTEPKNAHKNIRKDSSDSNGSMRSPHPIHPIVQPIKNAVVPPPAPPPPVALAHPMPVSLPPAANRAPPPRAPAPPQPRPNSNEPKPLDGMTEEEARAERKRRQRLAQEEFRLKMIKEQKPNNG